MYTGEREPFVTESFDKELVESTLKRLNENVRDRTYSIDQEDSGKWYIFEVEDEDEI